LLAVATYAGRQTAKALVTSNRRNIFVHKCGLHADLPSWLRPA
jgi:hypothetical protein